MGPGEFQGLAPVPVQRLCGCGGRVRWSHLRYLGRGRSAPIYTCVGCGLVYRGNAGEDSRQPASFKRRAPLPAEGPPENPVLDEEVAARLRHLLSNL